MMAEFFLGKPTIASLFDSIWLVLAVRTPHCEPKVELWVSWLELSQEEYFLRL